MEKFEEQALVEKIKKYINEKYGTLDYFTEQELINYCLGKAKEKKSDSKTFKVQDANYSGIIKYLQGKYCMSYGLIIESAQRLAKRYRDLSSLLSNTSTPCKANKAEVQSLVENKINSYYIKGKLDSHLRPDGTTIEYEVIEPVA